MLLQWHDRPFADLTVAELYAIIALRSRVFVVEQACVYLDADGVDPLARHVFATEGGGGSHDMAVLPEVLAYARIIPAGIKFAEVSIGRVVTAPETRGTGLGRELMRRAVAACGAVPVRIGAQAQLEKFYRELGFVRASAEFMEDGIPHIEMLRTPG